jgi:hypothetical protein
MDVAAEAASAAPGSTCWNVGANREKKLRHQKQATKTCIGNKFIPAVLRAERRRQLQEPSSRVFLVALLLSWACVSTAIVSLPVACAMSAPTSWLQEADSASLHHMMMMMGIISLPYAYAISVEISRILNVLPIFSFYLIESKSLRNSTSLNILRWQYNMNTKI